MRRMWQQIIRFFGRTPPAHSAPTAPRATPRYYDASYSKDHEFPETFFSSLVKTINWTEAVIAQEGGKEEINYGLVLRKTNPIYRGQPFYGYTDTWSGFADPPEIPFDYRAILEAALAIRPDHSLSFPDAHLLGQVLQFQIDLTTRDGAPCAESQGFVDESDIPPIDTWFYLTRSYLYCWIPNLFLEPMQKAIDVEILDSYCWIRDSNPDLQAKIEENLKAAYRGGLPDTNEPPS